MNHCLSHLFRPGYISCGTFVMFCSLFPVVHGVLHMGCCIWGVAHGVLHIGCCTWGARHTQHCRSIFFPKVSIHIPFSLSLSPSLINPPRSSQSFHLILGLPNLMVLDIVPSLLTASVPVQILIKWPASLN